MTAQWNQQLPVPLSYLRVTYHCVRFGWSTGSQLLAVASMCCVTIPFSDLRAGPSHRQTWNPLMVSSRSAAQTHSVVCVVSITPRSAGRWLLSLVGTVVGK